MGEKKFFSWSENFVEPEKAKVIVFGVPLGKNSAKMIEGIRKASWFIETFDIAKGKDLLELKISDIGNIILTSPDDIFIQTKKILEQRKIPLILGKSHLLTFYALKAFENVKLVSFDAHADIKDFYMDEKIAESIEPLNLKEPEKYNCTTWLRRFCELGNEKNVCLIGVRSCDFEDYKYMKEKGILYFTPTQIKKDEYTKEEIKKKIREFVKDSNVYISIDIDVFDPSLAPAVEHPEPFGLNYQEFLELIREVCKGNVVGLDLVEIEYVPEKIREVTEFLGIKVILEVLNLLSK